MDHKFDKHNIIPYFSEGIKRVVRHSSTDMLHLACSTGVSVMLIKLNAT